MALSLAASMFITQQGLLRSTTVCLGGLVAVATSSVTGCAGRCSVADDCDSRAGMTVATATSEDGKLCNRWGTTGSFENGTTVSWLDPVGGELCVCSEDQSNGKLTRCEGSHTD